mgnify:CR=1 FL=1
MKKTETNLYSRANCAAVRRSVRRTQMQAAPPRAEHPGRSADKAAWRVSLVPRERRRRILRVLHAIRSPLAALTDREPLSTEMSAAQAARAPRAESSAALPDPCVP